jgi:glycerate 2-kinase
MNFEHSPQQTTENALAMPVQFKNIQKLKKDALKIFQSGLDAVAPETVIEKQCRINGTIFSVGSENYNLSAYKNLWVIGAGKAAASMAGAMESLLKDRITGGVVCVKYDHLVNLERIKIIQAGHPIPDDNGQKGASEILETALAAEVDDLVICLISGGGSALMPFPAPGISLKDKQITTGVLLSCGATIHEINTIRKHLSGIKGGLLARAAHPATLVSLILSDVVGDDLDVIASGPTVPDTSTFSDCMDIIKRHGIAHKLPERVITLFKTGLSGKISETPKTKNPAFEKSRTLIIGRNMDAVLAARKAAEHLGYRTLILSSMIEGETRDVAGVHSAIAKEVIKTGNPLPPPVCILSGGETTVTVKGDGLGGRNQEFALAAALDLSGWDGAVILSGGTDGTDGPTDAAGALADGTTCTRAKALGLDAQHHLANSDAYPFFEKLGDLIKTGPTNTNVMDLRIVLVGKESPNLK